MIERRASKVNLRRVHCLRRTHPMNLPARLTVFPRTPRRRRTKRRRRLQTSSPTKAVTAHTNNVRRTAFEESAAAKTLRSQCAHAMNLAARLTPVPGSGKRRRMQWAQALVSRTRTKAAMACTGSARWTAFEEVPISDQPCCITSEFSGGRRPSDGTTCYASAGPISLPDGSTSSTDS
jgi:hypothetical protein